MQLSKNAQGARKVQRTNIKNAGVVSQTINVESKHSTLYPSSRSKQSRFHFEKVVFKNRN